MIEAPAACARFNATKLTVWGSLVSFSTWKDVILPPYTSAVTTLMIRSTPAACLEQRQALVAQHLGEESAERAGQLDATHQGGFAFGPAAAQIEHGPQRLLTQALGARITDLLGAGEGLADGRLYLTIRLITVQVILPQSKVDVDTPTVKGGRRVPRRPRNQVPRAPPG